MTVSELIEKLKEFPADHPVAVEGWGFDRYDRFIVDSDVEVEYVIGRDGDDDSDRQWVDIS